MENKSIRELEEVIKNASNQENEDFLAAKRDLEKRRNRKEENNAEPEVEVKTDSIPTFSEDLSERVDIHGFHIEEALPYLDKYLDQAYMAKFPQVYIVHGAGTGALREAVIEFLKKHPHIKSMQPGEKTTVAYLR